MAEEDALLADIVPVLRAEVARIEKGGDVLWGFSPMGTPNHGDGIPRLIEIAKLLTAISSKNTAAALGFLKLQKEMGRGRMINTIRAIHGEDPLSPAQLAAMENEGEPEAVEHDDVIEAEEEAT